MTVGIAAMCRWLGGPAVVCASDRMITSGDIEFEPARAKIYSLTNSLLMLIAGDTASQIEIYQNVRRDISNRLSRDPSWIGVREAAQMVADRTIRHFSDRAVSEVLRPFGLDWESFISKQNEMRPEFYRSIMEAFGNLRPDIETIVAGIDAGLDGETPTAHVYLIDQFGDVSSRDAAGFASIGAGRRHADSQFMFAGHTAGRDLPDTLLLTHTAKRRSEAAPGVGRDTDIFIVGGLGGVIAVPAEEVEHLNEIYRKIRERDEANMAEANVNIREHFASLVEKARARDERQSASEESRETDESINPAETEDPPPTTDDQ